MIRAQPQGGIGLAQGTSVTRNDDMLDRVETVRRRAQQTEELSERVLRRAASLLKDLRRFLRGAGTNPTPVPILIVEDDTATRQFLETALTFEGYSVTAAANGREALERLAHAPRPRLILLDWMMPEMDGAKFWRTLQKRPRFSSVPVVVISAARKLPGILRRFEQVAKPVELDRLLDVVGRYARLEHSNSACPGLPAALRRGHAPFSRPAAG